jgi:hypothetical protein
MFRTNVHPQPQYGQMVRTCSNSHVRVALPPGLARLEAAAEEVDRAGHQHLVAELDAPPAQDALRAVVDDRGAVLDRRDRDRLARELRLLDAKLIGILLKRARAVLLAREAVVRVVRQEQVDDQAAHLAQGGRIGADDHARRRRVGA